MDAPQSDTRLEQRVRPLLETIYGDRSADVLREIVDLVARHAANASRVGDELWNQRDVVLITYGDQVRAEGEAPLVTLRRFLLAQQLDAVLSAVHVLPFCPSSSDDGFSVIDYRAVDPALGDWSDIDALGESFDLMFDLVLNHCSQHSAWFQAYLKGTAPYDNYFIDVDPSTDLSAVTRPRSLPLLTPFDTAGCRKHVWTTFSADQVDLNYAEPRVLLEMLDVLLLYARHGARIVRLDAIAYLWKQIGTSCIHLPQTHAVVQLLRAVLDAAAPGVLVLTETNVPHKENVSYFGRGDEAHIVYQFSLPPLLLDAYLAEDAGPLNNWLHSLEPAAPGTTYLNFTASHDGVGVRPLEGLLSSERFGNLIAAIRDRGGQVSTRRNPAGEDVPYELNISYFSALGAPGEEQALHVGRFLASQALMLAVRGIPAIYFHSLVGTPNDLAGYESSGQPRRINRRKYAHGELNAILGNAASAQAEVLHGYRHLLSVRKNQTAFHPDAQQTMLALDDPALACEPVPPTTNPWSSSPTSATTSDASILRRSILSA